MSAQRLDVQGLRALSITSVILFHFYPQQFPNGYLGVDVFFIISGYLIFTIFSQYVAKNYLNWSSISHFYWRRLARVVPLSLVYVCSAVIAYSYMATPVIIQKSQNSAWRALLFLTNIFVVIEKDNYFERLLDENLFTHTWSLAVEIFGANVDENVNAQSLEDEQKENEALALKSINIPYLRHLYWASFLLTISLPLFPLILPNDLTRILLSAAAAAIVIYGGNIANPILSNRLFVFVGDISFSLYLFHWPFSVYLSSSFNVHWGVPLSLATSITVYNLFEKRYRRWTKCALLKFSAKIFALAIVLICFSPQLNRAMQKKTIISMEATIEQNERMFKEDFFAIEKCSYVKRKEYEAPFGLCTMPQKGQGRLKFCVIGNSYAANQGEALYEAFKPYFSEFSIYSIPYCEVFSSTKEFCDGISEFKEIIDEFKPDVVFILQRYFVPRAPIPHSDEEDKIYEEMRGRLDAIRNMSNLFFIEDSIPAIDWDGLARLSTTIREGKTVDDINVISKFKKASVIYDDEPFVRARTRKLKEHCGDKCHFFDIKPAIVDKAGQVTAVDEDSWLAIYDPGAHLTKYGQTKVAPIYNQLARQYGAELRKLEKKLYPTA